MVVSAPSVEDWSVVVIVSIEIEVAASVLVSEDVIVVVDSGSDTGSSSGMMD